MSERDLDYQTSEISLDSIKVRFDGMLSENSELPDADMDFSEISNVYLDFSRVNFVNSGGVKKWILFAEKLSKYSDLRVVFTNCPRIIIDQVNMIIGFLPKNGVIESVIVPLHCQKCDRGFKVRKGLKDVKQIPTDNDLINLFNPDDCEFSPECKNHLEVDGLTDYLFNFMKK